MLLFLLPLANNSCSRHRLMKVERSRCVFGHNSTLKAPINLRYGRLWTGKKHNRETGQSVGSWYGEVFSSSRTLFSRILSWSSNGRGSGVLEKRKKGIVVTWKSKKRWLSWYEPIKVNHM